MFPVFRKMLTFSLFLVKFCSICSLGNYDPSVKGSQAVFHFLCIRTGRLMCMVSEPVINCCAVPTDLLSPEGRAHTRAAMSWMVYNNTLQVRMAKMTSQNCGLAKSTSILKPTEVSRAFLVLLKQPTPLAQGSAVSQTLAAVIWIPLDSHSSISLTVWIIFL